MRHRAAERHTGAETIPGRNLDCGTGNVLSFNPEYFREDKPKKKDFEDAAVGFLQFYYPKGPSLDEYKVRSHDGTMLKVYVFRDGDRDVAEMVVTKIDNDYHVARWAACESHTSVWGRNA